MRDYVTEEDCLTVLSEIGGQVAARLRKHSQAAQIVSIAVGFAEPNAEGQTHWSAQVHVDPTSRTADIKRAVR